MRVKPRQERLALSSTAQASFVQLASPGRRPMTFTRRRVSPKVASATVKEPVRDVGGGRLVATVTDPDGNVLGLLQDR